MRITNENHMHLLPKILAKSILLTTIVAMFKVLSTEMDHDPYGGSALLLIVIFGVLILGFFLWVSAEMIYFHMKNRVDDRNAAGIFLILSLLVLFLLAIGGAFQ